MARTIKMTSERRRPARTDRRPTHILQIDIAAQFDMTFHILFHAAVDLLREIHQRLFAVDNKWLCRAAVSCHSLQRHCNRLFCALYFELSCLCDAILCRDFIAVFSAAQCIDRAALVFWLINFPAAENLHARRFLSTVDVESHIVLWRCSHCDCHLVICCRNSKGSARSLIFFCSRFVIVAAFFQRIGVHAFFCRFFLHQSAVRIRSLIHLEHCLCRTLYRDLRIRDLVRQDDRHRLIDLTDDQRTRCCILIRKVSLRRIGIQPLCKIRCGEYTIFIGIDFRSGAVLAQKRYLARTRRRHCNRVFLDSIKRR